MALRVYLTYLLSQCHKSVFLLHRSKYIRHVDYDDDDRYADLQRENEDNQSRLYKGIIRQRYFKQKSPNLLFWSEKTKIRTLHNEDPDYWTLDKLSESFPALPDTIKKVLKSRWEPKSSTHVERHDKSVLNNWTQIQINTSVSEELKYHLKRFVKRDRQMFDVAQKQNDSLVQHVQAVNIPVAKPKHTHFSRIITSLDEVKSRLKGQSKNVENNSSDLYFKINTCKK